MRLYKFQKKLGTRTAVTTDQTGANLPAEATPWILVGPMKIDATDGPRIGAASADIIAAVEADGYYVGGGK